MWFRIKQLDWVLIVAAILLVIFGLVAIYSAGEGKNDLSNFKKQIVFFIAALIAMFVCSFLDWRFFRENSILLVLLYLLCLAALAGLFFLAPQIRGVRTWYKIGPVSVDPIQILQLLLLIILAKYFSARHIEMYNIKHILLSGVYIGLPIALIFFQPNMGSVIVLILLWLGVLVISGIKLRHFFILVLIGFLMASAGWNFFLKDYQKERIVSFIEPVDPLGANWSQTQAKIAVGSGGVFGKGFFNNAQTRYGFLPEPHTDFIFAAIAEMGGILGVAFAFLLFLVLIWRIVIIAVLSRSNFPRLFAAGFIILVVSQLFIHIGMNLGIMPIVGISLPFVSYGGANLLTAFIAIGILQNIKNNP